MSHNIRVRSGVVVRIDNAFRMFAIDPVVGNFQRHLDRVRPRLLQVRDADHKEQFGERPSTFLPAAHSVAPVPVMSFTFLTRPSSSGTSLPPTWSVLHQASGTNRGWVTVKPLVSPCSKKRTGLYPRVRLKG